ncbi:MAG: type II toxin-antitoxin system RatA family toxin [Kineosporiaceae bacterium]
MTTTPDTDPRHAVGRAPTTGRLRAGLRANAVFSTVSAVLLLVAGPVVAEGWGLGPTWLAPVVGVGLVGFGLLVARVAVQPAGPRLRRQAVAVTAADLAWVLGTAIVLIVVPPRPPGVVVLAVLAGAVAALALAQVRGLLASADDDPLADDEVVEVRGRIEAPPGTVWPLIADHDLYGRLAPGLASVEVVSEPGEALRRRCTNSQGSGWEETCTLWEEGRRFAVEVDTSEYPYPIGRMQGLWQVDPDPSGSLVTLRLAAQPHSTLRGGLMAILLRPVMSRALRRVLDGWRERAGAATALPA